VGAFSDFVADALADQAGTLALHWQERALAAAPRAPSVADAGAGDAHAESVARALPRCLHNDARWQGEVMRLGWTAGAAAYAAGWSMHHLLKDGELLVAVYLSAAEQAAAGYDGTVAPSEVFASARRIHRAGALYQQAGATGFMHAYLQALRHRYRTLRHDLRNPLGTIRSALSLMEDETVPLEARSSPRVRAMLGRNAGSLDQLIGSELGDSTVRPLVNASQVLSLREVALAVRRDVRDATRLGGCDVVVGDELPHAQTDGPTLELALSAAVLAGLRNAAPGTVLRIGEGAGGEPRVAALCLTIDRAPDDVAAPSEPAEAWDAEGIALAESLALEAGGRLTVAGDVVRIELQVATQPARAPAPAAERASGRNLSDELGSVR
jgi:hypothetical protein